jgi:hypothetical protein
MMERAAVEQLERKMDRMTDAEILEKYGIVVEEEPAEDELIWDYDPIDAQLPDPRYQVWATDEQLNVPVEATVNEFSDTARGTESRIKHLISVEDMYQLQQEKLIFMGTYHADKVEFRCEGDRVLVELYWF